MKKCVAVLTRGYNKLSSYHQLIRRNHTIQKHYMGETDVLIMHEGNIQPCHQSYIKQQTKALNIIFINIKKGGLAFQDKKKSIRTSNPRFPLQYRHMCHFWFVGFWHFVTNYDIMLRVDEDCCIDFDIDHAFNTIAGASIVSGIITDDADFVVVGLNDATRRFMSMETNNSLVCKYPSSGPYTNVLGLNLSRLRENDVLMRYVSYIDKTDGIYMHRWGDLPLWGEAITYILQPDEVVIDKSLSYYHGSHHKKVN